MGIYITADTMENSVKVLHGWKKSAPPDMSA